MIWPTKQWEDKTDEIWYDQLNSDTEDKTNEIRWYDQLNSYTEDKTNEIRWYDQLNSEYRR